VKKLSSRKPLERSAVCQRLLHARTSGRVFILFYGEYFLKVLNTDFKKITLAWI
jgi:hypothetical protein